MPRKRRGGSATRRTRIVIIVVALQRVGLLGGAFNRKRQIGATLTYLCQLVAALWLLGLFAVRGAA